MHHQHRKDRLGASDYLSVNHSNQWILAILLHCQGLEDAVHGSARRLQSGYVADTVERRLHLRQKFSHLLANMLSISNAGMQSGGLQRCHRGTQFGSNFIKSKVSINKKKQPC
jgi:hypothetical protein